MQNIPRWKKSDRGSSHFRHGLDPRLQDTALVDDQDNETMEVVSVFNSQLSWSLL